MKKLLIFLFTVCASIILTGCNSTGNSGNEDAIEVDKGETAVEVYNPSGDIYSAGFINGIKSVPGFEFTNEAFKNKFATKAENAPEIPENKLYSFAGIQSAEAKNIITSSVNKRFKQPPYIPENISFDGSDKDIFLYSMLYENFQFYTPFPVITSGFAYENGKYKYFGHFPETRNKTAITNNITFIEPLFYVSENDCGIKLQDLERKYEMLLYLTESDASFDELYTELMKKAEKKNEYQDRRLQDILAEYTHGVSVRFEPFYKIPFINITKLYTFDGDYKNKSVKINEETGKIKNALSAVRIKINNEESKNKVIGSTFHTATAGGYAQVENRVEKELYYFDKPFVLFLRKQGSDKPYFAVRIKNGKYLQKVETPQN